MPSSRSTMVGARPRRLVDHEQLRLAMNAMPSEHLLLTARQVAGHLIDALLQRGSAEHLLGGLLEVLGLAAVERPAARRCSATVSVGHARPAPG
jgi:hypothetical protein